jgi:hypothetical protein
MHSPRIGDVMPVTAGKPALRQHRSLITLRIP